jgi:hypothetical protein
MYKVVITKSRRILRGKNKGKIEYTYELKSPFLETVLALRDGYVRSNRAIKQLTSTERLIQAINRGLHCYIEIEDPLTYRDCVVLPVLIPSSSVIRFGWFNSNGKMHQSVASMDLKLNPVASLMHVGAATLIGTTPERFMHALARAITATTKKSLSMPGPIALTFKLINK